MLWIVPGTLLILLGLPFLIRGWIFTLRPESSVSLRARERNLRLGLETDMKRWGRRVRRLGLLLVLAGGALVALGRFWT
ncbi:MAG: hypothetical protein IT384_08190 [Deltaproteobacteria bacterium]|nr:hypothetical protein [Deltaproteobacteria bacterium]